MSMISFTTQDFYGGGEEASNCACGFVYAVVWNQLALFSINIVYFLNRISGHFESIKSCNSQVFRMNSTYCRLNIQQTKRRQTNNEAIDPRFPYIYIYSLYTIFPIPFINSPALYSVFPLVLSQNISYHA